MHGNTKYFTNEERLEAIKNSKNKYMNKKQWTNEYCQKTYLLKNKWNHRQTKLHKNNLNHIEYFFKNIELFFVYKKFK